jgi:hypothetical protein
VNGIHRWIRQCRISIRHNQPEEERISTGSVKKRYSRRSEIRANLESSIDKKEATDVQILCGNTPDLPRRIGQNPQVHSRADRHKSRA